MRATEFVTEIRAGLDRYVRQQLPAWPEYVLRDFVYKNIKNSSESDTRKWLDAVKRDYPVKQWRLEKLTVTMKIFDAETQRRLAQRQGGSANPYQVPNDAERHATQAAIIQQQGVSKEPIIVMKTATGYELLEGWHRTIQHLTAYPNGYTGPAWVGYL